MAETLFILSQRSRIFHTVQFSYLFMRELKCETTHQITKGQEVVNDHSKQKVFVDQLPIFLSHLTFEVVLLGLTYSQSTPGPYTIRSGVWYFQNQGPRIHRVPRALIL